MKILSGAALSLATATLVACGGTPISFASVTPQPAADAYSCALSKVNELGYTVTNTSKEAGFITADKQKTGALERALLGSEDHDQLTISVFNDGTSGQRKIRVTAAATSAQSNLFGTKTSAKSPSGEAVADANTLLTACSTGPISRSARGPVAVDLLARVTE